MNVCWIVSMPFALERHLRCDYIITERYFLLARLQACANFVRLIGQCMLSIIRGITFMNAICSCVRCCTMKCVCMCVYVYVCWLYSYNMLLATAELLSYTSSTRRCWYGIRGGLCKHAHCNRPARYSSL